MDGTTDQLVLDIRAAFPVSFGPFSVALLLLILVLNRPMNRQNVMLLSAGNQLGPIISRLISITVLMLIHYSLKD